MPLGCSTSLGRARGKSKAIVRKRRKEVQIAKSYSSFNASPVQASTKGACSYPKSLSETFYHNGTGTLPTINDIVYKSKRARSKNKFIAGHYKVALRKTFKSLQINSVGVVIAEAKC